jgi:hypothetical protein
LGFTQQQWVNVSAGAALQITIKKSEPNCSNLDKGGNQIIKDWWTITNRSAICIAVKMGLWEAYFLYDISHLIEAKIFKFFLDFID